MSDYRVISAEERRLVVEAMGRINIRTEARLARIQREEEERREVSFFTWILTWRQRKRLERQAAREDEEDLQYIESLAQRLRDIAIHQEKVTREAVLTGKPFYRDSSSAKTSPLFTTVSAENLQRTPEDCGICLDPLTFTPTAEANHGNPVQLPCNHTFHDGCVREWLGSHNHSCPMCRKVYTIEWVPEHA